MNEIAPGGGNLSDFRRAVREKDSRVGKRCLVVVVRSEYVDHH